MMHSAETIDLTFADGLVSATTRIAVPGGWLYSGATAVFVPDPTAPHVRDDRRLKLREGCFSEEDDEDNTVVWSKIGQECVVCEDRLARLFTAWHADDSFTQHGSLLEAHDALIASGSESPFVVVVGVVPKAKVEGGGV